MTERSRGLLFEKGPETFSQTGSKTDSTLPKKDRCTVAGVLKKALLNTTDSTQQQRGIFFGWYSTSNLACLFLDVRWQGRDAE